MGAEGDVIRLLTLTGERQADNYHSWNVTLLCVDRVILESIVKLVSLIEAMKPLCLWIFLGSSSEVLFGSLRPKQSEMEKLFAKNILVLTACFRSFLHCKH